MSGKDRCSLKNLRPLKDAVEAVVREAGFTPINRALRREVGDVVWFFDWGIPYDDRMNVKVSPAVAVGSEALMNKVGIFLPVEPGSAQLHATLTRLAGDVRGAGVSLADGEWEASARTIVSLWESHGRPLLESIRSTDDLVRALREGKGISTSSPEKTRWNLDVWEGRIDPVTQPLTTPVRSRQFASLEEYLRVRREEREAERRE